MFSYSVLDRGEGLFLKHFKRCRWTMLFILLRLHLSLNHGGRWGTTEMTSQPVLSIFLPSRTWRTLGLSILCCLPTSSSVCLVFFPLLLCLARWFWPEKYSCHSKLVSTLSMLVNVDVSRLTGSVELRIISRQLVIHVVLL